MPIVQEKLTGMVRGTLVAPASASGLGVVVLHGSSGRQDLERARLFANHGAVSLALQWFGEKDQVPGICEVPLETFFSFLPSVLACFLSSSLMPCASSTCLSCEISR